jgi:hypothetical protein
MNLVRMLGSQIHGWLTMENDQGSTFIIEFDV